MTPGGSCVAVLIEDGFDDDAVEQITRRFEEAGMTALLVAPVAGRLYHGRDRRSTLVPQTTAGSARAGCVAAVVIPGGYAPDRLRLRHAILDMVRDAISAGIPVGALGHGAQVLISAGAIAGRTVTCWPSIAIDVKNAGGLYVDRPVVEDRGVITARKADDAAGFADAVLRAIDRAATAAGNDTIA
jgi:protease I